MSYSLGLDDILSGDNIICQRVARKNSERGLYVGYIGVEEEWILGKKEIPW